MIALFALLAILQTTLAAYSTNGPKMVAYWGQSSGKSLAAHCEKGDIDIIIIGFVNNFKGSQVSYNFAGNLVSTIAKDINTCHEHNVKVFLSLGGGEGAYTATTDSASATAKELYSMFGPKGTVFDGAKIDGFDLDIEKGSGSENAGYPELVSELKKSFGSDLLVSAAPQCVYPDAHIGDAVSKADIDMIFIQFYNNECSLDKKFNWSKWSSSRAGFANPNMKMYIGLPGDEAAAPAGGYVPASKTPELAASAIKDPAFGGFMVWDANVAEANDDYIGKLKKGILGRLKPTLATRPRIGVPVSKPVVAEDPETSVNLPKPKVTNVPGDYPQNIQNFKSIYSSSLLVISRAPLSVATGSSGAVSSAPAANYDGAYVTDSNGW